MQGRQGAAPSCARVHSVHCRLTAVQPLISTKHFFCCLLGLFHCTPRSRLCIFRDAALLHTSKTPQPAWLHWGISLLLSLPHLGDPAAQVGAGTPLSELSGPQQVPPSPAEDRWHGHRVMICWYKQTPGFCCPGCHLVGLVWHMHLPGHGSQEQESPSCHHSALLIQITCKPTYFLHKS